MDRGTAELRRLDYRYVDLPYTHGDWEHVGGSVEFQRLATGMWIIKPWAIRMPHEAAREGGFDTKDPELVLVAITEQGANVVAVRTVSGDLLEESTGAALYGLIADGGTGQPVAGASVELRGPATARLPAPTVPTVSPACRPAGSLSR